MHGHETYMQQALALAKKGQATCSPNPMVGCIIVKDGNIVGQGFHEKAGCAHAEINALGQAKSQSKNATLYVTLEPCCHFGKTSPCTTAIIKAGIKKVFVACVDPNPLMNGKGIAQLRKANITVEVGLLSDAAQQLNEYFFHAIKTEQPFVLAKWAMSFDGKTITHKSDTRNISNANSQTHAHAIRTAVDAILIGANTARYDNPMLTARLTYEKNIKQPLRIILSRQGKLNTDLKIFNKALLAETILITSDQITEQDHTTFLEKNIKVMVLAGDQNGSVSLSSVLKELGKLNIRSLLVEGGMEVLESFFAQNLVNKIHLYLAPVIIASLPKKIALTTIDTNHFDNDFFFSASVNTNV